MKTTLAFEIATGLDQEDPDTTEELEFEVLVEVNYDKPDHSVGVGASYEVIYDNLFTLCGPEPRVFTEPEMEALVGLGGVDWDKALEDHRDRVIDMYNDSWDGNVPDDDDEREWDDPSMGGREY
jgi:hypothetical protein